MLARRFLRPISLMIPSLTWTAGAWLNTWHPPCAVPSSNRVALQNADWQQRFGNLVVPKRNDPVRLGAPMRMWIHDGDRL